jgi:hypothetical protein
MKPIRPISDYARNIGRFIEIAPFEDPVSWACHAIDFSEDVSAERANFDITLSPHLREPLMAWDFTGKIKQVTVIGIEQHGKTLLEVIGALWCMNFMPGSMLCVYPSDDLAEDINTLKYEPLMRKIPALATELATPRSKRDDRYKLASSTMFFQGAGRKIISKSVKIRIADEMSAWPGIGGIDNFEDLRKRGRSYSESMLYAVTTVRKESDKAWKEFIAGSQGYWTLRCQHCGELTMRSCDLHNLQFESFYNENADAYMVIPDSIRLICPVCKHEHLESEKSAMNQTGEYVHVLPERKELTPSFQFGALCSQFPFMSWRRIAEKCLASGKRADVEALEEFDNSWRGLPFKPRKVTHEDIAGIRQHAYNVLPPPDEIEAVFIVSDTQDTFSPTGVFALDIRDNLYLLEYANVDYIALDPVDRERINQQRASVGEAPCTVLEDYLSREWFGLSPLLHVIDKKGHRTREVEAYARRNRNVAMYAGALLARDKWTMSKNAGRTVLVSARSFQADLIYYLYNQKDRSRNYIYLPEDLPDSVIAEITCVQPDKKRKNGHFPENWEPLGDAVHDAFDVLKMALFAVDFMIANLKRSRFNAGKSPRICRRWEQKPVPDNAISPKGKRNNNFGGESWINR